MAATVSLALSVLLAAQPAAPASQPEGPAPAPAADTTSAPTSARPPEPRWRGTGLLATAGVLGGIGFGANLGRVIAASRLCRDLGYDNETQSVSGIDQCIFGSTALGVLAPIGLFSNTAAFAFAAGGGSMHGRWAAHRTAFSGDRKQNAGLQIGLGAGLMTAGILTYLGVRIASFADALGFATCNERNPIVDMTGGDLGGPEVVEGNVPGFRQCMGRRMSGYLAGIGIGQTLGVVGVGLLTHGASYNRNLKLMRYITRNQLRLQPNLSWGYAGLSLSGRF
ncbi:hypothetical protein SAMN02745121_07070 [Nannocystis exedens]|uniref:Uncharacterized protein n=1 Tax=Nannocystis exedens TaxID=54 RepID=A0A1I2G6A8_9BACT|nr:hypothetical protein [Nannocystis exedens]PCC67283.1 hypothetical protein NAEX_00286 [Nannocystis exedens]SFF12748.1 hypothetical protein SAMN02745121_07070 [Nannocystis exedens]